ncbi:MAG: hypothetical protein ACK4UO_05735 [Pseudolabrys sp.]
MQPIRHAFPSAALRQVLAATLFVVASRIAVEHVGSAASILTAFPSARFHEPFANASYGPCMVAAPRAI